MQESRFYHDHRGLKAQQFFGLNARYDAFLVMNGILRATMDSRQVVKRVHLLSLPK